MKGLLDNWIDYMVHWKVKKGPGALGKKPARKLIEQNSEKISLPRFDKVGTADFPLPDPDHGVPQMLAPAILFPGL
jgi:thiosulfate reductase/polysulfide reductase chain A